MEFNCKRCGLTCCGTPMGTEQICEDCFDKLHRDNMGVNIKGDKGMKFVDAIGKYEAITRDGGTTVYSKNSEGTIVRKVYGIRGDFQLNYDLLISTGWVEHKEYKLILPERVSGEYGRYYYIDNSKGQIKHVKDYMYDTDDARFKNFNYFTDRELAQYVADKQLIQRIELVLHELNRNKFKFVERLNLIGDYIIDNYKDILDRINEYESRNRV